MKEGPSGDQALWDKKVNASLSLEVLDSATSSLKEVLKLMTEGAEVENLDLAERKAKELYKTALNVWAKLKERQLIKTYGALHVETT
jgi:hypothetical protein